MMMFIIKMIIIVDKNQIIACPLKEIDLLKTMNIKCKYLKKISEI